MSLMDLSSVILSLSSGTYVVTRRSASAYTNGLLDAPTTSTFSATGSMQPASGRDLQRLEEGMRTREARVFWTPTLLQTAETGGPDTIAADGDTWEVSNVERWAELGQYWKVILLKVGG
jgi:hypothetical protein